MNQNSRETANWVWRVSWHSLMIGGTNRVLPTQWSMRVNSMAPA